MRYLTLFVVLAALLVGVAAFGAPPTVKLQTSAQEKAANLRAQLAEVETKQADLTLRLQTLAEELKPENIEKNLAGVGSTRPEDLREQRRRQLEIERNGLQKQLDLLNTSHSRLETAIAQADADAYRQSAAPVSVTPPPAKGPMAGQSGEPAVESTTPAKPRRVRRKRSRRAKRANHVQTGKRSLTEPSAVAPDPSFTGDS
jgi:peptidoglycan hydrolase CwlO-like protein